MMGQRQLLLVGLLAAVTLGTIPRIAAAEDDATVTMARERFNEGVKYFDAGKYDLARAAFLQVYALKRHPAVLLNLAQSELRSGHSADAAGHFSAFLQQATDATDAEKHLAASGFQEALTQVYRLEVHTDLEAADIYVDGERKGTTPLESAIYLAAGKHKISAKRDDLSSSREVVAVAGRSGTVNLVLQRPAAAPSAPKSAAKAPVIAAKTNDHQSPPKRPSSSVPPAEESKGGYPPFFSWLTSSPPGLIGGGLTIMGLGGGAGFAIFSKKKYDDANTLADEIEAQAISDRTNTLPTTGICRDPRTWLQAAGYSGTSGGAVPMDQRVAEYESACAQYSDDVDNADRFKTLSYVGFATAGAAATATIIAYLFSASDDETASRASDRTTATTFVPVLTESERGIVVVGHF